MKTKRFAQWSLVILTVFTLNFYVENLFASYNQTSEAVPSKSTSQRLVHARELMGSTYAGSFVEKSANVSSVTRFVYNTVQNRIDDGWRTQASEISATILSESEKKGFDPLFVLAVIQTESQFDPSIIGTHGEIGLMQIKPDTAQWIAKKEGLRWKGKKTLRNPAMNVKIGIAYLAFLRKNFSGAARHYVAAYNMGPANVRRLASQSIQPKEYPLRVMTNYMDIYEELMAAKSVAQL